MIADIAGALKAIDKEWPLQFGLLDQVSTDDIQTFEGSTCQWYRLDCLT